MLVHDVQARERHAPGVRHLVGVGDRVAGPGFGRRVGRLVDRHRLVRRELHNQFISRRYVGLIRVGIPDVRDGARIHVRLGHHVRCRARHRRTRSKGGRRAADVGQSIGIQPAVLVHDVQARERGISRVGDEVGVGNRVSLTGHLRGIGALRDRNGGHGDPAVGDGHEGRLAGGDHNRAGIDDGGRPVVTRVRFRDDVLAGLYFRPCDIGRRLGFHRSAGPLFRTIGIAWTLNTDLKLRGDGRYAVPFDGLRDPQRPLGGRGHDYVRIVHGGSGEPSAVDAIRQDAIRARKRFIRGRNGYRRTRAGCDCACGQVVGAVTKTHIGKPGQFNGEIVARDLRSGIVVNHGDIVQRSFSRVLNLIAVDHIRRTGQLKRIHVVHPTRTSGQHGRFCHRDTRLQDFV